MKYLCLAYYDPEKYDAMPKAELDALVAQCQQYDAKLKATGALVLHGSLEAPKLAGILRPRGGKTAVTDGPYVETKEQAGGFFLINAKDKAEAMRIAENHPAAHLGESMSWGIEVREIGFFEQF